MRVSEQYRLAWCLSYFSIFSLATLMKECPCNLLQLPSLKHFRGELLNYVIQKKIQYSSHAAVSYCISLLSREKKEVKLPNHFLGLQEATQLTKVVTKQHKARIKHHKQLDFIWKLSLTSQTTWAEKKFVCFYKLHFSCSILMLR